MSIENKWWLDVPAKPKPVEKKYETIVGKENYRKFLLEQQGIVDPFKNAGPLNPDAQMVFGMIKASKERASDIAQKKYNAVLPEYFHHASPKSDKKDFRDHQTSNGHKFHLNVPVAEVRRVAEYLKAEDFEHKYLKGGEPIDGKIFTLYLGSHEAAYRLAQKLSADLGSALVRPAAVEEIEYAPRVVGRFAVRNLKYTQYGAGLRGIPCLDVMAEIGESTKEHLAKAFELTYGNLTGDFKDYFHG